LVGTLIFSIYCNELVIDPVEKMVLKVSRIADNPLAAAQEEENEAVAMEKMENMEAKTKERKWWCSRKQ